MTIRNFEQAYAVLEQYIPRPYASSEVYTLDRIRQLLDFLGNPQEQFRVIHLAGTSGKTSTAYYCAALLYHAGYKVGLTVSPHVDEINERVQVNMVPLEETKFCAELSEFMDIVDRSGVAATYYELMVAFAYWEFARQAVDYAVVEVGLGGLLDGTNTINRADKVCVITDIGLDHTRVLGRTITKIAAQKAGIIHAGNQVYMYKQTTNIMKVVAAACTAVGGELHVIDEQPVVLDSLPLFQQRNLGLAVTVVEATLRREGKPPMSDKVRNAAARTYIPGRMETFHFDKKTLILDGAHNAQKMARLTESITAKYPDTPIAAMVAFVAGEDIRWQQGISKLLPHISALIITSFATTQDTPKRSVDPERIRSFCNTLGFTNITVIENSRVALHSALESPLPLVLVTGSFYLLGTVRAYMA